MLMAEEKACAGVWPTIAPVNEHERGEIHRLRNHFRIRASKAGWKQQSFINPAAPGGAQWLHVIFDSGIICNPCIPIRVLGITSTAKAKEKQRGPWGQTGRSMHGMHGIEGESETGSQLLSALVKVPAATHFIQRQTRTATLPSRHPTAPVARVDEVRGTRGYGTGASLCPGEGTGGLGLCVPLSSAATSSSDCS